MTARHNSIPFPPPAPYLWCINKTQKMKAAEKKARIAHLEGQIKGLSENLRGMLKYGTNEVTREYADQIRRYKAELETLKTK